MKRLLIFAVIASILLTGSAAYANDVYEDYAIKLKKIGVFIGTDSGFELDRTSTRAEAAVMFVRLLGAEKEAQDKKYKHPFTDVPKWANDHVGYLYHEKLTYGTGATTFGSNDIIDYDGYCTFILRALGYSDANGDFEWNEALRFADDMMIFTHRVCGSLDYKFRRKYMARLSYLALKANLKGHENYSLIEKLVDMNAITADKAERIGLLKIEKNGQPITELSKEMTARLLSYPLDYENEAKLDFGEMFEKEPELVNLLMEKLCTDVIKLSNNEKFFINEQLFYKTWNNKYLARGVLQITKEDGTITEQDIGIEFWYGRYDYEPPETRRYRVEEIIPLGAKRIIKFD
ncbi:hypothetical protein [Phosphitispora fastidiosa]|uniref:hypothetical protein n=1 Tax=Phosphitispora fastidiosa TaxID=2837202 RepID=UPI001E2BC3BF|nr:hypothetical protein [Phosphitispora fastidiosa]MBU7007158.1 hypothetical protein [Phosphitispora fastidiosa]